MESNRLSAEVFLADEDPALRAMLGQVLRHAGCDVVECADGVSLFDALRRRLGRPGARGCVVVAQGRLPALNALQILHSLRGLDIQIPFVLMTRLKHQRLRDRIERAGAAAVLVKPFSNEDLLQAIRSLAPANENGRPRGAGQAT